MSEMLMRFMTILLIILFLSLIFIFGNHLSFMIISFLIGSYAFYEWITITSKSRLYLLLFIFFISLGLFIQLDYIKYLSLFSIGIWLILIISMFMSSDIMKNQIKKNSTIIGFFIIVSFFFHLITFFSIDSKLSNDNSLLDGKHYLLLFISLLTIIDTFSYLSGKIFGTLKIVPQISPNKTIEGYIGGYISTVIVYLAFLEIYRISWAYLDIVYLTLLILFAFSGDLFMSLVKRTYEIKDTGNLLPGHGGLLDRLDSYLPSIPLFFIWIMI